MDNQITWQTLCFALSVNNASVGNGGIYYKGRVYRQAPDCKRLEIWDSKKNGWVNFIPEVHR